MRRFTMTRLRDRGPDDAGSTLLELVVGMALMGVFLSIFTTAIFQMGRTITKVDAVTQSAGQANQAFLKLDKLVRYASAVTTVGKSTSGYWYVELDNTATQPETCTQLRIAPSISNSSDIQLQQRTWTITTTSGTPVVSSASSWRMVADGVTNNAVAVGSADQPFTVPTGSVTVSSPFQQLTITLVFESGTGDGASTTRSAMTFTALNSNASAVSNSSVCQQKGRP
jgi:type II secretory pathway pseudopilin PulG